MSGIGGFKGVSADQDARFSNKQKKLMKSMKFPKELDLKVDPSKVNWLVMTEWVAKRVTELLGVEDDVLIQTINNKLQEKKMPEARELHIDLIPFLEKNTSLFMKELWALLASASCMASGIPQQILDEKAEELRKKKELQEKNEELRLQRKRDREGQRGNDDHMDYRSKRRVDGDPGGPNRWDQGKEPGRRPRESGRPQRNFYRGGGHRFAPYRRDRSRSPYRRSPRRRSRSPPRKPRGHPRGMHSRSPRGRGRSSIMYAPEHHRSHLSRSPKPSSRSPNQQPSKFSTRADTRLSPASPHHSKQDSPPAKRTKMRASPGSGSDRRSRSPRKSRSVSPSQKQQQQGGKPALLETSDGSQQKSKKNEDSNWHSGDGENVAHIKESKKADQKLDVGHVDQTVRRGSLQGFKSKEQRGGSSRSSSPRSPSPRSPPHREYSGDHAAQRPRRPVLSSSPSPRSKSLSPKRPLRSEILPSNARSRSPFRRRNFEKGRARFPQRGIDLRSQIVPRQYDDIKGGPRTGPRTGPQSWGKSTYPSERVHYHHDSPEYGYSNHRPMGHGRGGRSSFSGGRGFTHGERNNASRSRGDYYRRPESGSWKTDRRGSPVRERRAEYAYRGTSPLGLRSRVEIPERAQSPASPFYEAPRDSKVQQRSPDDSSVLKQQQRASPFDGDDPQTAGGSSDADDMKKQMKRKKEKKSKSKKHKKHKDSKKKKKNKSLRPSSPASSDDITDKVVNEKRIEELRKKALQSMGKSPA